MVFFKLYCLILVIVILDQMITIRGRVAAKLLRTYSKQNCKGSRPSMMSGHDMTR